MSSSVSEISGKGCWQQCKVFAEDHALSVIRLLFLGSVVVAFGSAHFHCGPIEFPALASAFYFGYRWASYDLHGVKRAEIRLQHRTLLLCYQRIRENNPQAKLPEISIPTLSEEGALEEKASLAKRHLREKAERITMFNLREITLKSWPKSLELPHLETLDLRGHPDFANLPSNFFETHPHLKILNCDSPLVSPPLGHKGPLTITYTGRAKITIQPLPSSRD